VRISRKAQLLGLIVSMVCLTAGVSPAFARVSAAAKTYKFNYTVVKSKVPTNLEHQTGKMTGSPFGKATFTASTEVPITTYVLSFAGGKLDIKLTASLHGVIASGPWKVTGGSGKFAHAHGGGHGSGAIDGSKQFHFTGKVSL
jgi:hypothetical protein